MIMANLGPSIIFIVIGIVFKLWPPKEINHVYGYRTPFAKKNNEVWKEANNFGAIMMIFGGVIGAVFSLIITFICNSNLAQANVISVMGSLAIVLIFIFYTEIHLRKIFDKDGKRKSKP